MREPKYKYWDGELKQMCDVRAIVWHNNMIANIEVFDSKTMFRNPNMFYGHALLEYTGLKDKNGKEGYFDDLVKWGKSIYQIIWDDNEGVAWLQRVSGNETWRRLRIHLIKQGEIIGNLHESKGVIEQDVQ